MVAVIRWSVSILLLSSLSVFVTSHTYADDAVGQVADDSKSAEGTNAQPSEPFQRFEALLNRAKLKGRFTVLGREDREPSLEEYTILSVKKTATGDYWLFNARIKYGDRDVTLPLPIEVKWAGDDTPVITLTDFAIPGLGTFSARVVLYNNKYAGTWTHGKVGGHLYGVIEKLDDTDSSPTP